MNVQFAGQVKSTSISSPPALVLQRQCACGNAPGPTGECAACRRKRLPTGTLQTKLTINEPGDKYEQEADRIADQVMRMPEPDVQRQMDDEEGEAEELLLTKPMQQAQAANARGSTEVPLVVHDVLRTPGRPLEPNTRAFMESRFRHNFSQVRVHTDAKAAESARTIQAQAYTVDHHIAFDQARYRPQSDSGRYLLAHELVHVIQQNAQVTQQRQSSALQRAVAERPQEHQIPGARVCMVHLHGDEGNALRTAQGMHRDFCANLMHLNNRGRCVTVSPTCQADPNRIFSTDAITQANAFISPCTCPTRERTQAIRDLRRFRLSVLEPAIGRCRGGSGSGMAGPLPVVVFHNNAPGGFGIRSYQRGGSEEDAAETVASRLGGAQNPTIANPRTPDDFLLVTQPGDFQAFRGRHNVVLQSTNVASSANDGSLSVALANQQYINIETGGKQINNRVLATNRTMAEDVFRHLRVPRRPCVRGRVQRTPEEERRTPPSIPYPHEEQREPTSILEEIINWLRRLFREVVRVLDALDRMPSALPRQAPPTNLPRNCQVFGSQTDLDRRKSHWRSVISSMPVADVVSWIIGVSTPPTSVTSEATQQKDCLLHAIREAARQRSSGISLPRGGHTRSARRGFARQQVIWNQKFNFQHPQQGPFGRITDHARRTCGTLLNASETEWNPGEPRHRVCWGVTPLPGTSPPALPTGTRPLNNDERQFEILQTSSAPGLSRHHAGTDFDLFDPNMDPAEWETGGAFADEYSWLQRNASTYGFSQSFTATSTFMRLGYIEERWHWSYYPIAQALLDFARTHQGDIERELLSQWGTSPQFSFIRRHWREYMFNVSEHGVF